MGTSIFNIGDNSVSKDHPHAYGDKLSITILPSDYQGSSPRVWGQVLGLIGR